MLTVDFSNLFNVFNSDSKASIPKEELAIFESKYSNYQDLIISREQGFLEITENLDLIDEIKKFTASINGKFTNILVLGIGGSMLGPQTIIDSLVSKFNTDVKIHFLDNIDPDLISEIKDNLDFFKTLILVQTKSGGTPETISQYFLFKEIIQNLGLKPENHFVFVTDPEAGYLRKVAKIENIPSFEVPKNVGGRFSVLTAIGLLSAGIAGLNMKELLKGANWASKEFFYGENTAALELAATQFLLNKKGQNINVFMPYSSKLKMLANWYTQLLSESVGKKEDLNGQEIRAGITPLPALGATDQHSQLQLFTEGPNDKLIMFVEVQNFEKTVPIPNNSEASFNYLNGKTFNDLISAEFKATRQSLTENLKPNITISIEKVDEFHLGALFVFLEISVAFLGELLNINTFNQPGVERSKILTKENLLK